MRRVDGTTAENDLASHHLLRLAATLGELDAGGPLAVEQHAVDHRPTQQIEVRSLERRIQVGASGTEPAALFDVAIELGEALLLIAVYVAGDGIASLLHGLEKRVEQRRGGSATLKNKRALGSAKLVAPRHARLHALEVGQAVRIVPRAHTRVGGPSLVVERVAALEDHAVDAAGPAENLAASVIHAPTIHKWFGLGFVLPVVELAADWKGKRRWHVDEDIPLVVAATGLEHQHRLRWVGAQPVSQRATC